MFSQKIGEHQNSISSLIHVITKKWRKRKLSAYLSILKEDEKQYFKQFSSNLRLRISFSLNENKGKASNAIGKKYRSKAFFVKSHALDRWKQTETLTIKINTNFSLWIATHSSQKLYSKLKRQCTCQWKKIFK